LELADLGQFVDLGVSGVLSVFVLMLLAGRIRPKSWMDEIIELHKQRAADAIAALDKRDAQLDEVLKALETGNNLAKALTEAAERNRP
jgi:hypothetical protein